MKYINNIIMIIYMYIMFFMSLFLFNWSCSLWSFVSFHYFIIAKPHTHFIWQKWLPVGIFQKNKSFFSSFLIFKAFRRNPYTNKSKGSGGVF